MALYEVHDSERMGYVGPRSIMAFLKDVIYAISDFKKGGIASNFSKNRG